MLAPAEAEKIILDSVPSLPTEACALGQAHGRVLREAIIAERDSPPFDRVTMDGYAVRSPVVGEAMEWRVTGFQPAGAPAGEINGRAAAIEIATGAALPSGADSILPYEDTKREGEMVSLLANAKLAAGQNIHRRATDFSAGAEIVAPGVRISAREVAVAASCGYRQLQVSVLPRIAVIATGDELVEVEAVAPLPHQIRRSNDYALAASLACAGYTRVERFHLNDARVSLLQELGRIAAEFDVLLLTGGVSKGKLDLLPSVLDELGVKKHFQGVAQRPGKPFWFGLTASGRPVFALPGNPVSTYLCFQRYVTRALAKMSVTAGPRAESVVLAAPLEFAAKLAYLSPVRLEQSEDGLRRVRPRAFNTSGDFSSLLGTDGYVELPCGPVQLKAGSVVRFQQWG